MNDIGLDRNTRRSFRTITGTILQHAVRSAQSHDLRERDFMETHGDGMLIHRSRPASIPNSSCSSSYGRAAGQYDDSIAAAGDTLSAATETVGFTGTPATHVLDRLHSWR